MGNIALTSSSGNKFGLKINLNFDKISSWKGLIGPKSKLCLSFFDIVSELLRLNLSENWRSMTLF